MILNKTFTKGWIDQIRKKNKAAPHVIERALHALALVEQLALQKIDFVFKGGTSLLILLPKPTRFSVDVDIITHENRATIEKALDNLCSTGLFGSHELQVGRSYQPGIPKAHYKLVFVSILDGTESYVLLDILYEKHAYPIINGLPIINEWLDTGGQEVIVNVPSVDSMLGDKMTAYAPDTIGIPFEYQDSKGVKQEKSMEVIKQLYDVGNLFDHHQQLAHIKMAFDGIADKEISYRSLQIGKHDVLDDIIGTSLALSSMGKIDPKNIFPHLTRGLGQFQSFLYHGNFKHPNAILSASKAAYIASAIKAGYTGTLAPWEKKMNIKDYLIGSDDYKQLKELKYMGDGQLYYWYKTLELLGIPVK